MVFWVDPLNPVTEFVKVVKYEWREPFTKELVFVHPSGLLNILLENAHKLLLSLADHAWLDLFYGAELGSGEVCKKLIQPLRALVLAHFPIQIHFFLKLITHQLIELFLEVDQLIILNVALYLRLQELIHGLGDGLPSPQKLVLINRKHLLVQLLVQHLHELELYFFPDLSHLSLDHSLYNGKYRGYAPCIDCFKVFHRQVYEHFYCQHFVLHRFQRQIWKYFFFKSVYSFSLETTKKFKWNE